MRSIKRISSDRLPTAAGLFIMRKSTGINDSCAFLLISEFTELTITTGSLQAVLNKTKP